jgi:hypothetical protein
MLNKLISFTLLAMSVGAVHYGGQIPEKRSGAHCKNYWQLSIRVPSLTDCMALVNKNINSGRCPSSGKGYFAYGRVTDKHWECMCCKDPDALTNVKPHSAFNIY